MRSGRCYLKFVITATRNFPRTASFITESMHVHCESLVISHQSNFKWKYTKFGLFMSSGCMKACHFLCYSINDRETPLSLRSVKEFLYIRLKFLACYRPPTMIIFLFNFHVQRSKFVISKQVQLNFC